MMPRCLSPQNLCYTTRTQMEAHAMRLPHRVAIHDLLCGSSPIRRRLGAYVKDNGDTLSRAGTEGGGGAATAIVDVDHNKY